MRPKCLYRGYYIAPMPTAADGGFESRVAVLALSGERTRQQRFLDFESYATEEMAVQRAIEGAKEWIDIELGRQNLAYLPGSTDFIAL